MSDGCVHRRADLRGRDPDGVFEQFHASIGPFSGDLRTSGCSVSFDSAIAGHFSSTEQSVNPLSTEDFGFSGHDLGSNYVFPTGSN